MMRTVSGFALWQSLFLKIPPKCLKSSIEIIKTPPQTNNSCQYSVHREREISILFNELVSINWSALDTIDRPDQCDIPPRRRRLCQKGRHPLLSAHLRREIHLLRFEPISITIVSHLLYRRQSRRPKCRSWGQNIT